MKGILMSMVVETISKNQKKRKKTPCKLEKELSKPKDSEKNPGKLKRLSSFIAW